MAFGRKTPPSVKVACEQCGKQVSVNSKNTARKVTGWVVPRTQGGANHIKYQQNLGAYAHTACLDELYDPVSANQGELF